MENIKFYDTNELLHSLSEIEGKIYLSSITLQELEHIKVSKNKDEDVRFEARKVTRFLRENEDRYVCIVAEKKHYNLLEELNLPVDNDNLIIACAKLLQDEKSIEVEFITDDICCYNIAKHIFKLECSGLKSEVVEDKYTGFKSIIMTDEEMAKFYENENKENIYGLLVNEYLIIKDTLNQPLDAWRCAEDNLLVQIDVKPIKSVALGKLKAKDFYQQCVLDSFYNNNITVVKGKAGTGKSHLAMNFLMSQMEKGKIDKVIMFVNPIATRGSAKLGYYKGTKDEKLLDSTIGSFLNGKLGDSLQAQALIQSGKLMLLPVSDIRGFDTSGMNAGIYITEAQNMSVDMMKLAIQRIGEDCVAIIDGDCDTQVDDRLFEGSNNGLKRLSQVFRGQDLYGEIELQNCYRSRIASIAEEM
jgi:predicted ribonuclease YlaK